MIYLILIPLTILGFILHSAWSVWGLEKYYNEKLNGNFFGPFKEVVTKEQKAFIIVTKEFKEWKTEQLNKWFYTLPLGCAMIPVLGLLLIILLWLRYGK
jgi:hypothetical protein